MLVVAAVVININIINIIIINDNMCPPGEIRYS